MGENTLVPCVDDTSGPDLERDVEAFEAIALDVCGQLFVPLRLPLLFSVVFAFFPGLGDYW